MEKTKRQMPWPCMLLASLLMLLSGFMPASAADTYRLLVQGSPSGAGRVSVSGTAGTDSDGAYLVAQGSTVTLTASAYQNFQFGSWTIDGQSIGNERTLSYQMPDHEVAIMANFIFNPASPGDPDVPERAYEISTSAKPSGAGKIYVSGDVTYTNNVYKAKQGAEVSLQANAYSNFKFKNWTINGEVVSNDRYYDFTMPAGEANIVANFTFDPASPGDPDVPKRKFPVSVISKPGGAGSFNFSQTRVVEGDSIDVWAYPRSAFKFKGWLVNGEPVPDAPNPIWIKPDLASVTVTGLFDFDPASPSNPGANYWNPATGKVIIDDFTPGDLYYVLSNLVGYNNFANVSSLIVRGVMTSSDFNAISYLYNAETIDLSRVGGLTAIPSYAFQDLAISSLILPSTVTSIGGYAFRYCGNLQSITVYAYEPPLCSWNTFSGLAKDLNITIYVPASSIELYSNAEYWKDFTILPITSDAHVLQVNLPDDAADGRYKNNSLEVVNISTGVRQKYVVSDRMIYTFNGMQSGEHYNVYMFSKAGLEIGRIEDVIIPDDDIEVAFDSLKRLFTVYAQVVTPEGEDVTSEATIEWLKPLADGTVTYLRKATSLGEVPDGQALICRVTLNNRLGIIYAAPEDAEFTVGDDQNTCIVSLAPMRGIALSGQVVDADGAALSGAFVSANQTLNGKFSKTYTAKTDRQGKWAMTVLDAPETRITYAAAECVNVNDTIGAYDPEVSSLDLGVVTLRSIVGARVTYGFTYKAAGADEGENFYSDYQNVVIAVYNVTQGRAHSEVSMQYPILAVLDENINAGDELRLTATSKTGAFNPIEKTVTVGENQRAGVTFDIVGKGGIAATFEMTDNPSVIAMLYSSKGELLKKQTYSEAKTTFTELEDGNYILVTMGQSDLMNSILRLSSFDEIGLTEGKDYVKNSVKVESGKLTEVKIAEVPAFDESIFYYTNSNTSFTSNKSSITTGDYLTLRSAIYFKGVYKNDISNVALVVDLPEACDFVEQSVIQGPNLLPYTLDNNRLTIQLGNSHQNQTRFCVIPTAGGSFNATASIVFEYNGKSVTQPIGSAVAEVKELEIVVPASTSSTTFQVSGKAPKRSAVNIYVDNMLTSSTETNAKGDWSAECEIENPENFSEHFVFAEFISKDGAKLLSETKSVIYNPLDVNVNSVEMTFYNGWYRKQYSVVWNFTNCTTNCNKYDFYVTTDMTFLIDLDYKDLQLIPFVWLHVYTSDGSIRSLRADYDANKDKWIAVDEFSSSALPTRVSVSIENMMFNLSDEVSYNLLYDQYVGDISLSDVNEENGETSLTYVDSQGNELAEITSYESDESVDTILEKFKSDGFTEDELINDESDYVPEDDEDTVDEGVKVAVDSISGSLAFFAPRTGGGTNVVIIRLVKEEGKQSVTQLISSIITRTWRSFYRTYFDEQACAQVTEYKRYTEHMDKYVTITTSTLIAHTIFINTSLLPSNVTKIPKKTVIAKIRRIRNSSKRYTTSTMEYAVVPKNCNPKPPKPPIPPIPPIDPILDPSGYVYEAIPENRVEGVQASIYYKETKEDMYGDSYEEIVLWDAEEYAQKNPLFTDEYGMYRWDVPQGLWQVKFEKDGYVTAYSEWLPVPPPQLEVNIGIVQNKQPEVIEARAYEEGVEVQFDKYMNLSTLTTDNIYVTANGEKLNGEIRFVDSALADEYASEDDASATRYASRARFVPEEKLSVTTGEIRLTVSRNVLSYAGIPMTETYTQVLDVEKEVQVVYADDVKVLYGGEKEVTVYAMPYDAAVGRTLHIANSSDLIASIDVTEAVLDEEGKAVVKVKGGLPGRTQLSFTIDDVTATGECAVDVVTELITAEAPKASRASGTAVYRGTKIELTTDSKNATIYFTTDGSCPCDENGTRRKYTVPIIINEDMQITAMTSVGNGDDDVSETVQFNYTLKRSDMDFQMEEGWTWMSHNFESAIAPSDLSADENISRIMSQTKEVIRDPELGMIGTLTELKASESYKVETTAATARQRMSDVAWNPATPIALKAGWNWLGYPVGQTMSVSEAFAPTEAEALDIVVGQNGFAQFDGENWIGTLETMSPGMGYMYQSQSEKKVVYNTSIVSTASAQYATGISDKSPLALDIHKYGVIMPVVATLSNAEGALLDNKDYQVAAFCGTECRGIGRVVNGLVMMNVYGNVNDHITFMVTDAEGEQSFANDASLSFSETVVGDIFDPYTIAINDQSGITKVNYDGNIKVAVEGDMLRIKGINPDEIELVEVYDLNGLKLIRETRVPESGIRISTLTEGVYVVIVNGNGEYTYHKIAVR